MFLESIGTATPPHALTIEDRHQIAEQFVTGSEKEKWFVPYIFEKSKVERRFSVLLDSSEGDLRDRQNFFLPSSEYDNNLGPTTRQRMQAYEDFAAGVAAEACRRAFEKSAISPEQITHLVTASCTGFCAPGFDLQLVDLLSLPRSVERTHLGFMGCHAGLNCFRTARAYCSADPTANVLVCAAEFCSLHYQYAGSNSQKVANAIFADGAGAAIVSALPSKAETWKLENNRSYIIPETADLMTWQIGDHGFTMGLSEKIPATIDANIRDWLSSWLSKQELDLDSIRTWAVHPGGPQILIAFQSALRLEKLALDASWEILKNYGNMSSATIFFVLDRLIEQHAPRPCVAVGFGPGLTIESCLLR